MNYVCISLLVFCLVIPCSLQAEEPATNNSLLKIGKDGSISAPGVHISEDGSIDALGIHIEGREQKKTQKQPSTTKNDTTAQDSSQEATQPDLTINNDGQTMRSQEFKGQNLTINGDDCTLSGSGTLNRVTINGNGTTLEIAGAIHALVLNGDANRVSYQRHHDTPTSQLDNGEKNTITQLER